MCSCAVRSERLACCEGRTEAEASVQRQVPLVDPARAAGSGLRSSRQQGVGCPALTDGLHNYAWTAVGGQLHGVSSSAHRRDGMEGGTLTSA